MPKEKEELPKRKCRECRKQFTPVRIDQVFCSETCRRKNQGRIYRQSHLPFDAVCEECGKTYQSTHIHQRFCSRDCREENQKKRMPPCVMCKGEKREVVNKSIELFLGIPLCDEHVKAAKKVLAAGEKKKAKVTT